MHRRLAATAVATAVMASTLSVAGPASAGEVPAPGADAAVVLASLDALSAQAASPSSTPDLGPLVRVRPDVLVRSRRTMSTVGRDALAALSPDGGSIVFRAGSVSIPVTDQRAAPNRSAAPVLKRAEPRRSTVWPARPRGPVAAPSPTAAASRNRPFGAVGVDPAAFRAFTRPATAGSAAVWQAVARGEAIVSHAQAKRLGLVLGSTVAVQPAGDRAPVKLRVGAFATTGIPGADLVVDDATGRRLGFPAATGMLLTATGDTGSAELAADVSRVTRDGALVDLLTQPASDPTAFLSGNAAAKEFGSFSYRWFPDGTIQPDAAWVKANIQTTTVPIMERITCHRLMIPQLRGALQEVVDAGLADSLHTYSGCYVPRFIESNPQRSMSLHTWGIAIDMDAATNYRGIRGTMDARVVAIFKRWGFEWGGDWKYTDPMHFQLAALLDKPR